MMAVGWPTTGRVWVEVGYWITRWMTQLPSGEIRSGDPEPNLLGLGLASFGAGDCGSGRWKGVVDRSLIVRSAVPLVRGSTAGDPLSCSSVAGVLLGAAIVKVVTPSGGPASRPRSTCDLLV
jgi:hypothetical protein